METDSKADCMEGIETETRVCEGERETEREKDGERERYALAPFFIREVETEIGRRGRWRGVASEQ